MRRQKSKQNLIVLQPSHLKRQREQNRHRRRNNIPIHHLNKWFLVLLFVLLIVVVFVYWLAVPWLFDQVKLNENELKDGKAMTSLRGSWMQKQAPPHHQTSHLLPCERQWITEKFINRTCGKDEQSFSMFTAKLGHQGAGCKTTNFSSGLLPIWTSNENESLQEQASVQLLRFLRGKVKCFVGDSVTLQFFDAISHSLKRQALLHPDLNLTVSKKRKSSVQIPVNETGANRRWWGGMRGISEFSARLGDWDVDEFTVMRWYKHYVWSPWDVSLMESCDVITFNLALHYWPNRNWKGRNGNDYVDDVKAALDFLSNFTASKPGRVAIWRETLPQHFRTKAGLYDGDNSGCGVAIKDSVQSTQGYNKLTVQEFSSTCDCVTSVRGRTNYENGSLCLAYECSMNHTAKNISYDSVFAWEERNHVKHKKIATSKESSRVWWWPLFDLFDVPTWHISDSDCTHFCFIPQAYEMSWARLNDILNLQSRSHLE